MTAFVLHISRQPNKTNLVLESYWLPWFLVGQENGYACKTVNVQNIPMCSMYVGGCMYDVHVLHMA